MSSQICAIYSGQKYMAVFKTKISVCNKSVFFVVFFFLILYYDIEEWSLSAFGLCSGFHYFIICEKCSCCITFKGISVT